MGMKREREVVMSKEVSSRELAFSPDRLHNRPEAARYLLTLVTACSDRDTHTHYLILARSSTDYRIKFR